jgi:tetratricopeptide (TPR) repeat protein
MSATTRVTQGLAIAVGVTTLWSTPASADTHVEVSVQIEEEPYDAMESLLDEAAREALAEGNYERAWHFFWRLLQIDPHDTKAMREAGRVAHALGKFEYAAKMLARVDELNLGKTDPELHYLRGEALLALGEKAQAEAEFDVMVQQIGTAPQDRRAVLWLARVAALRGDLDGALTMYMELVPMDRNSAEYAEVMLYIVEAHILSKDWATAERLLRAFRRDQPGHGRGREMMAWVLDARGKLDEELGLRAVLADEWGDHPRKTVEYARALERAYDFPAALDQYREARAIGVDGVSTDIDRLEYQLSPELAGGMTLRRDNSGSVVGWLAGATLPLGGRFRLAVSATQESSNDGITGMELTSRAASAWGIVTVDRGGTAAVGATVRQSELDDGVGASALMQTSPERRVQLQVRGDLNLPWRESSSTVREGGVVDAAGAQVFASAWDRRLLFTLGGQVRRLGLGERPGSLDVHARQLFGSAGVDYIVSRDPTRVARGEVLDGEMLSPARLSSAAVVSYRHYEMSSDDPFGMRLVLVERSSLDEVSGVIRHVLDRRGVLGAELRGGVGYDWLRDLRLWRGGASLLLSATASSRLTLDYDVASESGTGLVGRRHAGSVMLHVDL